MDKRVIYSKCQNYDHNNINKSLDFIISNLPDLEQKAKTAKLILIKPNLISPKPPEKAVTTNPEVLICLIEKLKKYGANIIIADTPAGKLNDNIMQKLYDTCKMSYVEQQTGCKLNWDFSDLDAPMPDSKIMKNYKILQVAENADLIINFAKMKTHCFTMQTCATKNLYGIIPGLLKMQYHLTMSKIDVFSNMLLDIERYFSHKTIHFIDGIVGMEGNGPTNGEPFEAKCLLAANNPVYLDILACHIMGINPLKISTITEAIKRRIISTTKYEDLDVLSDNTIQTYNFKLPPERGRVLPDKVPNWLRNMATNLLIPKPNVNKDKCIGCRACEEICPPQLIKTIDDKAVIDDYSSCIRCYCCQEVCPQDAIDLIRPIGRKILGLLKVR
ncbi:MAG: DUF362 domain-containing protein [Cyanobacteriota bacterium]